MKNYRVVVTEERIYETVYTVEAENEEEAKKKAENGETLIEFKGCLMALGKRIAHKVLEIV